MTDYFKPTWPQGIQQGTPYRIGCDDKGGDPKTFLQVLVGNDGDVHVSMQEIDRDGELDPHPHIRVCTKTGGGRNMRTKQALLWLAEAIRLDNEENGNTERMQ